MELVVTVTAVGALRGCLIVNKQAPHDAVSAAPNAKSQLTVISTTEAWESRRESRLGDGKRLYQIVTNNYEVIFVFTQGVLERQCTEHQGCRHQLLMPAPGTPSALSLSIQKDIHRGMVSKRIVGPLLVEPPQSHRRMSHAPL